MKIREYVNMKRSFFNGLTIGRKLWRKALYTCSDFANLKYYSCPFVNFIVSYFDLERRGGREWQPPTGDRKHK